MLTPSSGDGRCFMALTDVTRRSGASPIALAAIALGAAAAAILLAARALRVWRGGRLLPEELAPKADWCPDHERLGCDCVTARAS
jgi:hypothetical protein